MKTVIYPIMIIAVVSTASLLFFQHWNSFASAEPRFVFTDTIKKPSVKLQDTTVAAFSYLMITDTADSEKELSRILANDYAQLFSLIKVSGAGVRRLMAFYHSNPPPFIVDVAIEVDKFPAVVNGRIRINKMKGGSAIVAHYRGPYSQVHNVYREIASWLMAHNQKAVGSPFEVYLNSPASVSDPYDLETDVYQLYN